jgi:hypothetical protein
MTWAVSGSPMCTYCARVRRTHTLHHSIFHSMDTFSQNLKVFMVPTQTKR